MKGEYVKIYNAASVVFLKAVPGIRLNGPRKIVTRSFSNPAEIRPGDCRPQAYKKSETLRYDAVRYEYIVGRCGRACC